MITYEFVLIILGIVMSFMAGIVVGHAIGFKEGYDSDEVEVEDEALFNELNEKGRI